MNDFRKNILESLQIDDKDSNIFVKPTDKKFGDYATNVALIEAKKRKISPYDYYKTIENKLKSCALVKDVVFLNGFINFYINNCELAKTVLEYDYTGRMIKEDKPYMTALVEFPSPNMAKPFSVGHLRSANQGWAARNILKKVGWSVTTDNHIGDYGTPFGIWAEGYELLSNKSRLKKDGIYELGRIYVEMRKLLKEENINGEKKLADRVQGWLSRLNVNEQQAVKYHELFYDISIKHMHQIMARLGVSTDNEYGESFYVEKGQKLVDEYIKMGVVKQNEDGSVVADLNKYGIETPMLLRKSNGLPLYATTDVATMVFRKERFNPQLVVYAVGNEQRFYFEQLFAFANIINIPYDKYHLSYGMIEDYDEESGKRKKISSRKGTILLEDLLDKAERKVREITKGKEISKKDVSKIAVGAIKFRDFSQDRNNNYLFDWDRMFSTTGFAGSSIQYSAVRIKKIMNDAKVEINSSAFVEGYPYEAEKDLLIKISEYNGLLKVVSENFRFHNLANYLYEVSKLLNSYYDQVPIIKGSVTAEEKKARVKFLGKIFEILKDGLDILGIEIPERM